MVENGGLLTTEIGFDNKFETFHSQLADLNVIKINGK